MTPSQMEYWAWIWIYAGLVFLSLGLFMPSVGVGAWLGSVLTIGGGLLAFAGVVLIYLRSRIGGTKPNTVNKTTLDKDAP